MSEFVQYIAEAWVDALTSKNYHPYRFYRIFPEKFLLSLPSSRPGRSFGQDFLLSLPRETAGAALQSCDKLAHAQTPTRTPARFPAEWFLIKRENGRARQSDPRAIMELLGSNRRCARRDEQNKIGAGNQSRLPFRSSRSLRGTN